MSFNAQSFEEVMMNVLDWAELCFEPTFAILKPSYRLLEAFLQTVFRLPMQHSLRFSNIGPGDIHISLVKWMKNKLCFLPGQHFDVTNNFQQ
jgi:hypothetical protein